MTRSRRSPARVLTLALLAAPLGSCGDPSATSAATASPAAAPSESEPKAPAAPALPPEIVREMTRLERGKPGDRIEAAMRLESMDPAAAAPAAPLLLAALASDDPDLRAAAARAAAAVAPGDATREALAPLAARDPDIGVRKAAIEGLVRIGGEAARSAARRGIEDDAPAVRAHAIAALAAAKDADSAARFADALADADASVVVAAVKALGAVKGERFVGEIGKLLAPGVDDGLKREALAALEELGSLDAETLPLVVDCLESPRLPVRVQAIATLRTVSGESIPFDADEVDEATRKEQVARWRHWATNR